MNLTFKDEDGNVIGQQQPIEGEEQQLDPVDQEVVEEQPQEVVEQLEEAPVEDLKDIEVSIEEETQPEPQTIDEDKVRAYLKERYEIESIEDVLKQPEPLPEDVDAFLKYKKETGRGFEDYMNLQKDWSKVDEQSLLREYYKATSPHLDDEDISYLLEDKFSYDEELDDAKDIKKKKVAMKDELYKAKSHFESLKEKYKAPLVSSEADLPEEYKKAYSFYSEYTEQTEKEAQLQEERSKFFLEKTNGLFNEEFKGFEFDLGERKQTFELKDVDRVKSEQSDITNFFNKHIDENGYIKDAASYHKALFAATNADAMARYFYEQGKADAIDGVVKETKNISMTVRDNKPVETKGLRFREVDGPSGNSLKFKK
jgi:hypothetical protein